MVQINVSQQLKASIGEVRDYEVEGTVNIDNCDVMAQGTLRLLRTDRGILAKGNIHADIELTCGRCLIPFNHHLALNIEEEYFPTTDINTGTAIPLPEEPGAFTIDEHNILDLSEAIRQYALMAIPMKPLCRQDCAGLCPTCGTNLNQTPCTCPPQTADPRWEGLRKLTQAYVENSADKEKGIK